MRQRVTLMIFLYLPILSLHLAAQSNREIKIQIDVTKTFQTIQHFSASDAWGAQFAGNWPNQKRNAIADWLFSTDTLANGNPRGIGLSMWRYNIGAGSAEQAGGSGIKDEWRRAPAFASSGNKKVDGQLWFLHAAKQRGVSQFLGFFNSPPVQLTKNGKAFSSDGKVNIDNSKYTAFAEYTAAVIDSIKQTTGITLDYISPVNEPQWDWKDGGQEGCPYTNTEIAEVVKEFDRVFQLKKITGKLVIAESGSLQYLLTEADKHGRGSQVNDFFLPGSTNYIGNLPSVAKVMAAHSYFTTSPYTKAVTLRNKLRNKIDSIHGLTYWQSEYCILGDNGGEINGSGKDLGMNTALYLAKVIHADLVEANAAAWHWWTAISAYNYKDGLVYIDKKDTDGKVADSKMMWALGNFSRFIRPGMQRIAVNMPAVENLYVSSYHNKTTDEIVTVFINTDECDKTVQLQTRRSKHKYKQTYTTNDTSNLNRVRLYSNKVVLLPKSITTLIMKRK